MYSPIKIDKKSNKVDKFYKSIWFVFELSIFKVQKDKFWHIKAHYVKQLAVLNSIWNNFWAEWIAA